jgi:hypothetical protein
VSVEIRRTTRIGRPVRLQSGQGDRFHAVTGAVQTAATASNAHPPCQPPGTITNSTAWASDGVRTLSAAVQHHPEYRNLRTVPLDGVC